MVYPKKITQIPGPCSSWKSSIHSPQKMQKKGTHRFYTTYIYIYIYSLLYYVYIYIYIYIHNILEKYLDLSNLGHLHFSLAFPEQALLLLVIGLAMLLWMLWLRNRQLPATGKIGTDPAWCGEMRPEGRLGLSRTRTFKCVYLFKGARFHSWDLSEIYESLWWIGKFGRRLKSAVPFCLCMSHYQPSPYHAFSLLASNMAQSYPFRSQSIYTLW